MIGGHCDSWTQEYINRIVNLMGQRSSIKITYAQALLLDWWGDENQRHNRRFYQDSIQVVANETYLFYIRESFW